MPWLRATAGQADRQPSSRASIAGSGTRPVLETATGITTTGQARTPGDGRQAGGQASLAHASGTIHPARGEAVARAESVVCGGGIRGIKVGQTGR
jgi:hypothetical protein